jgi:hypothetical protein
MSDRMTMLAEPTRGTEVQILLVTRRTVNDVFPVLIAVDFFVSGGSSRKVLQKFGCGTAMPFWIRVAGLYRLLVRAL